MNKKILLPIIVVALFVTVLFFSLEQTDLQTQTIYDLPGGGTTNLTTEGATYSWWGDSPDRGWKHYYFGIPEKNSNNPHGELVKKERIISSWKDDGYSETVVVNPAGAVFGMDNGLFNAKSPVPFFTDWWWEVSVLENGEWHLLTGEKSDLSAGILETNKIGDVDLSSFDKHDWNSWYTDEVSWTGIFGWGMWYGVSPDFCDCPYFSEDEDWNNMLYKFLIDTDNPDDWIDKYTDVYTRITSDPISFSLIGPVEEETLMRVRLMTKVYTYDSPEHHTNRHHCHHRPMVTDYVRIVGGDSELSVDSSGNGPGLENMFEDGQTMTIRVKTEYAGSSDSGTDGNWRFQLITPSNQPANDIEVTIEETGETKSGNFDIPDNSDYTITWNIPEGTASQYGSATNGYEWKVQIGNTIDPEHSKTYTFVVPEGTSGMGPTGTVQTIEKTGDYSYKVSAKSFGNPDCDSDVCSSDVGYFELRIWKALQGNTEEFNTYTQGATQVGSTDEYRAEFNIIVPYDGVLIFELRAYDTLSFPGEATTDVQWSGPSTEDEGILTVRTMSGNKGISGVSIYVDGIYAGRSNSYGKKEIALPLNQEYTITATYEGATKTNIVMMTSQEQETTFDFSRMPDIISILVPLLIVIISLIIAFVVPLEILWRAVIGIIGIIVAIFTYLILSGIIQVVLTIIPRVILW